MPIAEVPRSFGFEGSEQSGESSMITGGKELAELVKSTKQFLIYAIKTGLLEMGTVHDSSGGYTSKVSDSIMPAEVAPALRVPNPGRMGRMCPIDTPLTTYLGYLGQFAGQIEYEIDEAVNFRAPRLTFASGR